MIIVAVIAAFLQFSTPRSAQPIAEPNGRNFAYLGAWPNKILVIDEKEQKVVDRIELKSGVPEWICGSYDKRRLAAITHHRNVEVIDLATHKSIGVIPLGEANHRPLVLSVAMGPRGRNLYVVLKRAVKGIDRYTLETAKFCVVDLETMRIARMFDFPKEFDPDFGFEDAAFKISDDEKRLYLFRDDILVFDLDSFKQVDKIELSKPLHPGMYPFSLDGEFDPNEEPDLVTSLFTATDPVARRPLAGIVTINLKTRDIKLMPIGPSLASRGRLYLSPDRKKAYAVLVNDQQDPNRRPEFCVFDLETRRVIRRVEFENRPRFTFTLSGDGKSIYIYGPGDLVDIYSSETLKLEKTITVEGDITEMVVFR